jgi:hypothetical protein
MWLRVGHPGSTVLQDFDGEMPKLAKGENLIEAVEARRRRGENSGHRCIPQVRAVPVELRGLDAATDRTISDAGRLTFQLAGA